MKKELEGGIQHSGADLLVIPETLNKQKFAIRQNNTLISIVEIMNFDSNKITAEKLDAQDDLAHFRNQFLIPNNGIYMNGFAVGCQPKKAQEYVNRVMSDWSNVGLGMNFPPAFLPALTCDELLRHSMGKIVGSKNPTLEIVLMNGVTANLHLMMSSFYRPKGKRTKILLEKGAFPSDHYACMSQVQVAGFDNFEDHLILVDSTICPETGREFIQTGDILQAIESHQEEIALILLPGVTSRTGQFLEIEKITKFAKKFDLLIGWDLAHAVGNVPLDLTSWEVDFAVWCTYKYMNAGAGSIGGMFLHEKHANSSRPKLLGWLGHKDMASTFDMSNNYIAAPGALAYKLGTPSPLLVATLMASLEIFDQTSVVQLRKKSKKLTAYLEFLIEKNFSRDQIQLITTKNPEHRGCLLSMRINFPKNREKIDQFLADRNIFCVTSSPVYRLAPVPLYNSFVDVWQVINAFKILMSGVGLE